MSVYHKCGTKLVSSGKGDYGYCTKCKEDVHHLMIDSGEIKFSKDVLLK